MYIVCFYYNLILYAVIIYLLFEFKFLVMYFFLFIQVSWVHICTYQEFVILKVHKYFHINLSVVVPAPFKLYYLEFIAKNDA